MGRKSLKNIIKPIMEINTKKKLDFKVEENITDVIFVYSQ